MAATESSQLKVKTGGSPVLAALVAFLISAFVIILATLISAPTRGISIFPLGPYVRELVGGPGRWFMIAGLALSLLIGLLAAGMIYRVWGDQGRRQETVTAYIFLAPYLIITVIFTVGVLLFALYISFHDYDIFTEPRFSGIANYLRAFQTKDFVQSLYNVYWYAVVVTSFRPCSHS